MMGARPIGSKSVTPSGVADHRRDLPEEVPVALVYNGTTQAVMMATPTDLVDFGRGFSLTEGVGTPQSIDIQRHPKGIEVQMWLSDEDAQGLAQRRRAMAGPVGCGLCGIDSLDEADRPVPKITSNLTLTAQDIRASMAALRAAQTLHDQTRAVHGAGFFDPNQGLVASREDVGRHNALDKLIGAVGSCAQGAIVLTSRVSVEMVQKAAMANAPIVIAVSAPTTLAVDTAHAAGLTLVALARETSFEVFTHSHRIQLEDTPHVA